MSFHCALTDVPQAGENRGPIVRIGCAAAMRSSSPELKAGFKAHKLGHVEFVHLLESMQEMRPGLSSVKNRSRAQIVLGDDVGNGESAPCSSTVPVLAEVT